MTERYYCKQAEEGGIHCDKIPMTIQCYECIDKERKIIKENPYEHYYGWKRPID